MNSARVGGETASARGPVGRIPPARDRYCNIPPYASPPGVLFSLGVTRLLGYNFYRGGIPRNYERLLHAFRDEGT